MPKSFKYSDGPRDLLFKTKTHSNHETDEICFPFGELRIFEFYYSKHLRPRLITFVLLADCMMFETSANKKMQEFLNISCRSLMEKHPIFETCWTSQQVITNFTNFEQPRQSLYGWIVYMCVCVCGVSCVSACPSVLKILLLSDLLTHCRPVSRLRLPRSAVNNALCSLRVANCNLCLDILWRIIT